MSKSTYGRLRIEFGRVKKDVSSVMIIFLVSYRGKLEIKVVITNKQKNRQQM